MLGRMEKTQRCFLQRLPVSTGTDSKGGGAPMILSPFFFTFFRDFFCWVVVSSVLAFHPTSSLLLSSQKNPSSLDPISSYPFDGCFIGTFRSLRPNDPFQAPRIKSPPLSPPLSRAGGGGGRDKKGGRAIYLRILFGVLPPPLFSPSFPPLISSFFPSRSILGTISTGGGRRANAILKALLARGRRRRGRGGGISLSRSRGHSFSCERERRKDERGGTTGGRPSYQRLEGEGGGRSRLILEEEGEGREEMRNGREKSLNCECQT